MRDKLLKLVVSPLITAFLASLSTEQLKEQLDRFIDDIEDAIAKSETPLDDALLPVLRFVREFLDVPDND